MPAEPPDIAHDAVSATITLYSRSGCHLCDEALEAIEAMRLELPPFELREIDIESDDVLLASMLERIPVVELDGEFVCELVFDADRLRTRMSTLRA
jgi:glutaredoxin